jgi:SAM-dependent MidA family methyltransferase
VVEDVLSAPGEIDVTTPVDFAPLRRRAGSLGLQTLLEFPQSLALRTLGFDDWIEEQRSEQGRALDRRSGREAVGRWSARNRAYSLIDPGGLGSLRWLPLATPGVSWPPWLRTASLSEDESRWEDEMDGEAES